MKLKNRVWSRKNISNETQQVQHGIFHSPIEHSSISQSGDIQVTKISKQKLKSRYTKDLGLFCWWFLLCCVY